MITKLTGENNKELSWHLYSVFKVIEGEFVFLWSIAEADFENFKISVQLFKEKDNTAVYLIDLALDMIKFLDNTGVSYRLIKCLPAEKPMPSYRWYENKDCKYYPCHEYLMEINCLFCYCPLYSKNCIGNFKYIKSRSGKKIKDCSDCYIPHVAEGWQYIIDTLSSDF